MGCFALLLAGSGCPDSFSTTGDDSGIGATYRDAGAIVCEEAGRWKVALEKPVDTVAVDDNGRVFVTTEDGALHAYGVTGSHRWSRDPGDGTLGIERQRRVLSVANNRVFWSRGDRLFALDVFGDRIWSIPIHGAVAADNESVVVATARRGGTEIYRLRADDGSEIWSSMIDFEDSSLVPLSIALGANAVAVGTSQHVYVLDLDDGEAIWDGPTVREVNDLAFHEDGSLSLAGGTLGEYSPPLPANLNLGAALVQYDPSGEVGFSTACCEVGFEYAFSVEPGDDGLYWAGYYGREIERALRLDDVTLEADQGRDAFIIALDESGAARRGINVGGPGEDEAHDLAWTCNGDMIVGGTRTSSWDDLPKVNPDSALEEGFLVRLAPP